MHLWNLGFERKVQADYLESYHMSWKKIAVHQGGKLFKMHQFTYMVKGVTYQIEVDEFADSTFTGHGQHATDRNNLVESVTGKSIDECVTLLVAKIGTRLGV
jgi:hypothetical protein